MAGRIAALALTSLSLVAAQQIGHAPENHPKITTKKCTLHGGCVKQQNSLVLDSSSHPLMEIGTGKSCMLNGGLDPAICTTVAECAERCALEGVNYAKNGVKTSGDSVTLRQYLGTAPNIKTVSPRVYLLDDQGRNYNMLKLTNQEFTFTVDASNLPCGMNGALYLSQMEAAGGRNNKLNPAGASYGTGYCDAQCFNTPLINGLANLDGKGACCMEMDIWEANRAANQLTPHPCNGTGLVECTGDECNTFCDKSGCGYNAYGVGAHNFYGYNSTATVNTQKPLTVVTQFLTDNGKANGHLNNIKRLYVQGGKVIQQASFMLDGQMVNSITPEYCSVYASWNVPFEQLGALPQMGKALQEGMVLIMSIWNTNSGNMSWLDTGNAGPCNVTMDSADQIEAADPSTYVTFSDMRFGDIGSTY